MASGKFLGFIVNTRGTEANPDKIRSLLEMSAPSSRKEVHSLSGRVAALNWLISKSTDKCLPFYNLLRGNKKFEWTEECEQAFLDLKTHLAEPPVLSEPAAGEPLFLYLAVTKNAASAVLVREEDRVQKLVYYISKRFLRAESRCPLMELMAFYLILASRKLRPYFQSHSIHIMTDQPLRQVL